MNSSNKGKIAYEELSVGQKIMLLRKHHRISQELLSETIKTRRDKIVSVERGESNYTKKQLKALAQYFGIVGLPLEKDDREAYVRRHYRWRDYMKAGRMEEAKAFGKKLAPVVKLEPCDPDLVMLHRMFDVRMLAVTGEYTAAEEKLVFPKEVLENTSDENRYHYYFNKGLLSTYRGDYEESIDFFLKAIDIYENSDSFSPENDAGLYSNIARCYIYIDLPGNALFYLRKAKDVYVEDKLSPFHSAIDCDMALCYIQLNQLMDVEKLLEKCLLHAKSLNEDTHVGRVWHLYGLLNKNTEKWETAIEYFDKALECYLENSPPYFLSQYEKIHCLIESREFSKAAKLLAQIQASCTDEAWSEDFEALRHCLIISRRITCVNPESENYIENVAIPRFCDRHNYFTAFEYLKLFEFHFRRSRRPTRATEMKVKMLTITLRCFANRKGGE